MSRFDRYDAALSIANMQANASRGPGSRQSLFDQGSRHGCDVVDIAESGQLQCDGVLQGGVRSADLVKPL